MDTGCSDLPVHQTDSESLFRCDTGRVGGTMGVVRWRIFPFHLNHQHPFLFHPERLWSTFDEQSGEERVQDPHTSGRDALGLQVIV